MLALTAPGAPRLAYGFWRYQADEVATATAMLEAAREAGIDHIDTADIYGGRDGFGGAEALLGSVRKQAPGLFEGVVLATKVGIVPGAPYDSSAAYVVKACEAGLKRLGCERVDLLYIHRPDFLAHPHEAAGALEALKAAGKIGAVGVSNYSVGQVDAVLRYLPSGLAAVQVEFSALHAAPLFDGTLDQAMREGVAVAAWSPLAGGRLGEGADAQAERVRAKLTTLAARYGAEPMALALSFLLGHPANVTPIVGTKRTDRLHACVQALGVTLERADWYSVLEASLGAKMP